MAASFILVGGLAARRAGELDSLQTGCAYQDPFGEWWLSSYIEKTIKDVEQLPIPAAVGHAVKLLEELSASGRARTSEPWLRNIDRPNAELGQHSERFGFNLNWGILINDFADVATIKGGKKDANWRFGAHQLRRAFAIYYYHGNRYSNLDALSRFLRHFDPEVTRIYITEAVGGILGRLSELARAYATQAEEVETQAFNSLRLATAGDRTLADSKAALGAIQSVRFRRAVFQEVREEAGVERMLEVHDGIEAPIGHGAVRLYNDLDDLVERARKHVRLERPSVNAAPSDVREALPQLLQNYVKTHYLDPVAGGFAHCRCVPGKVEDLSEAVCLQRKRAESGVSGDRRPDYAFACIEDCLGRCPHGLALVENKRVVDETLQRAHAAARANANALVDSIVAGVAAAKAAVTGRGRA